MTDAARPAPERGIRDVLLDLYRAIDSDAYAASFQTLGQYRMALMQHLEAAFARLTALPPVTAEQHEREVREAYEAGLAHYDHYFGPLDPSHIDAAFAAWRARRENK